MPEECAIKYVGIRSETDISDVWVLCTHMQVENYSHWPHCKKTNTADHFPDSIVEGISLSLWPRKWFRLCNQEFCDSISVTWPWASVCNMSTMTTVCTCSQTKRNLTGCHLHCLGSFETTYASLMWCSRTHWPNHDCTAQEMITPLTAIQVYSSWPNLLINLPRSYLQGHCVIKVFQMYIDITRCSHNITLCSHDINPYSHDFNPCSHDITLCSHDITPCSRDTHTLVC